jgi:hypothetical protein
MSAYETQIGIKRKLEKVRRAGLPHLILAVSERLQVGEGDLEGLPGPVIFFKALQKHSCHQGQSKGSRLHSSIYPPQHFLNFFPLPHGHGSFRPTFC